ncbi:UNVERIFIED_CONTAM: hypothetical protein ABID98_000928 [Brevibacillus sp. OAP136]
MNASVYYDYFDGHLAPLWYVLTFQKGELDWHTPSLFVPISLPFLRQELDDFHAHALGLTVTLGELTLHPHKPGQFGISLPRLSQRAAEAGYSCEEVELFIMQVADLEELLQMRLFARNDARAGNMLPQSGETAS